MPTLHLLLFPELWNVPPPTLQQSLNSYQGDEDVLGLEWADLGLNVWSGLTDQGLLMFKAVLASRWHEKWQPQKCLLAPCPHSEFQFIFIPRAFSSEATRLLIMVFGDMSLTLENPPVMN